jgi:hypothetical protein
MNRIESLQSIEDQIRIRLDYIISFVPKEKESLRL